MSREALYPDSRTVDGEVYRNYLDACLHHGLLSHNAEWKRALWGALQSDFQTLTKFMQWYGALWAFWSKTNIRRLHGKVHSRRSKQVLVAVATRWGNSGARNMYFRRLRALSQQFPDVPCLNLAFQLLKAILSYLRRHNSNKHRINLGSFQTSQLNSSTLVSVRYLRKLLALFFPDCQPATRNTWLLKHKLVFCNSLSSMLLAVSGRRLWSQPFSAIYSTKKKESYK